MTAYGTTTGLPVGGKITDCTDGSMVLSGVTIVGRPCFTEGILSAAPNLVLGLKVVGSPPPLQPGDRVDLDLTNTNRASPDSTMAVLLSQRDRAAARRHLRGRFAAGRVQQAPDPVRAERSRSPRTGTAPADSG
nr:hypothetical protein GCM10020092_097360 [Actinoplanes digitatis]